MRASYYRIVGVLNVGCVFWMGGLALSNEWRGHYSEATALLLIAAINGWCYLENPYYKARDASG